jgi:hypothetical protein
MPTITHRIAHEKDSGQDFIQKKLTVFAKGFDEATLRLQDVQSENLGKPSVSLRQNIRMEV